MGWRKATFKDQKVWAEVDGAGALKVERGLVGVRYNNKAGAKVYRGGAGKVEVLAGAPIEDLPEPAAEEVKAPGAADAKKPAKSSKGSGFGKAGERTAAQAAMAGEAARNLFARLKGETVFCFTDGSSKGNPGPAGSGAVIEWPDGRRAEASKSLGVTTNNVAELTAIGVALDLLEAAGEAKERKVAVFTDSSYAHGVLFKNWKAKANQALIAGLRERLERWPGLEIFWVAGHVGIEGNERADELANDGVDGLTRRRGL